MYYDYNNNIEKGRAMVTPLEEIRREIEIKTKYLSAQDKYKEADDLYKSIENTIRLLQDQLKRASESRYEAHNNLLPFEERYLKKLGFDTQNYSEWGQAQAELREGKQPRKENR